MKARNILVTAQSLYLVRFQHLFRAIAGQVEELQYLQLVDVPVRTSRVEKVRSKVVNALHKLTRLDCFASPADPLKTPEMFVKRSRITERQIRALSRRPDLILHTFCLSVPLYEHRDIPCVMFLDYTMALCRRNWPRWAPFPTERQYDSWRGLEKSAYEQARRLFCVSRQIKASLVADYGIPADKVTVTGSSANFSSVYKGEKSLGGKRLLFNASDFIRKGGDLVLEAFRMVHKQMPEVQLVVIGQKLPHEEPGVTNLGRVGTREELQDLLLGMDLLLAPARCDPFPVLPMEAMNYGVPCIVSACDGNPDIVDDGVNGVILANPTAGTLAESMTRLLRDPELLKSMSLRAREKIRTTLNWNRVADTIVSAIAVL